MVRVYCGNNQDLPNGYERFGRRDECLQNGFGVGKHQGPGPWKFDWYKRNYAIIVVLGLIGGYLSFLGMKEKMNSEKAYSISLAIGVLIMFCIFFYFFIYGRKYCGKDDQLPKMYFGFGTRNECLRRGIGLGKHKDPVPPFIFVFVVLLGLILANITFSHTEFDDNARFFASSGVGFASIGVLYSIMKMIFI